MNKLVKDGKVAIIISGGYGAGWSTWQWPEDRDRALYDFELAMMLLSRQERGEQFDEDTKDKSDSEKSELLYEFKRDENQYHELIKQHLKNGYDMDHQFIDSDIENLRVHWIPLGTRFMILEYDGAESLVTEDDMEIASAEWEDKD